MTSRAGRLLGLPVQSRGITAWATLALFTFYVLTMCRSLSMYDSPELALVAEQLGLGHPFGQPLHTLLGALVTRLPGVDPLIALNGLSALAGALTVIPATSLAESMLRSDSDAIAGDARFVAPSIALLGVHPTLWEPATRIEVYPLAVFLGLWAAARVAHAIADYDGRVTPYAVSGLALGLAASANPVCAFGAGLAMTPHLIASTAGREIPWRAVLALIGGGLLGLTTYAYVFLVAGREDVVVWGAPTDPTSLRHYFTAADFTYKQTSSWAEWSRHVGSLGVWSLQNGLFAMTLAGFAGYALFDRRRGGGTWFLVTSLLFFVAFVARNGAFATDVLDYLGYLSMPIWAAAAGVGLLVAYLAARRMWTAAAAVGALALAVIVAPPGPFQRTRHLDFYTRDMAHSALRAAPDNAIIIVEQDHWIGPMWYLQEQRGVREDVTLLAYGLSSSEWYWKHLYRRHPNLEQFELRAPGGRNARVRRFLQANRKRPVQVERVALASRLGLPACPSDWLLDVRSPCVTDDRILGLAMHAAAALRVLKDGSPGTDGLIALVTLHRGHDLWSQGFPRAAVEAVLAGVPAIAALETLDFSSLPRRGKPAVLPPPAYAPAVALGHPARNLHYASLIARTNGAPRMAYILARLSEALGPVEPKFASPAASPANL